MKVSRIVLALLLGAFGASVAMADAVDPTVIIRKVDPPPVIITSPDQTFNLFATQKNNVFAFQNATGFLLTSITLDLFGQNLAFSCGEFAGGNIFANCSATQGTHGDWILSFFGVGDGFSGVEAATCSTPSQRRGDDRDDHNCNCTGGVYSFEFDGIPRGAVVTGTGTVGTPEPVTAVMLLGGLAGLAGLRRRRKA